MVEAGEADELPRRTYRGILAHRYLQPLLSIYGVWVMTSFVSRPPSCRNEITISTSSSSHRLQLHNRRRNLSSCKHSVGSGCSLSSLIANRLRLRTSPGCTN